MRIRASGFIRFFIFMTAPLFLSGCGEYVLVKKEGSDYLLEGQRLQYYTEDEARAEKMYQQAYSSSSRQVRAEAAYQLAQLAQKYEQHDKALHYLEDAFDAGYEGSRVRLAKAYMNASPQYRDEAKAERILKQHRQESVDAPLYLAELYLDQKRYEEGRKNLHQAEAMYLYSRDPAEDALQIGRQYKRLAALEPQNARYARTRAETWLKKAISEGQESDAPVDYARLLMQDQPERSAPYEKGLSLLQRYAQRGEPEAMLALGRVYYKKKENEKALHWFKELERVGDSDGAHAYRIAKVYRRIDEKPENKARMKTWFEKSIARGNPQARVAWARYQQREREKLIALKQRLEEKRQRLAQRERLERTTTLTPRVKEGFALLGQNQSQKAYRHFKTLADKGVSLHAMLMVDSWQEDKVDLYASTYRELGGKKIYDAVKENAAHLGEGERAQMERQWKLAVQYGSPRAAYQLAELYKNTDPKQAATWLGKAAEMGDGRAMLHKARQLALASLNESPPQEVFGWYKKAAEAGEAEGQYQTGLMYAQGNGVTQNKQKARYWLDKARENGYALPQNIIQAIQ